MHPIYMSWRKKVDSQIAPHLEHHIEESSKQKEALEEAQNPANAQLWIALANLAKQANELTLKMHYLEKAVQDLTKDKLKTTSKKDEQEIQKFMKKITRK